MKSDTPKMIVRVWKIDISGELEELQFDPAPTSLDQASELIGEGAYTTFRTYGGRKVIHLEGHFNRLEETAHLAGNATYLDRESIRRGLRKIQKMFLGEESRFRLTVDLEVMRGTVYIFREKLAPPTPQEYRQGVKVVTVRLKRSNPRAKLTKFIEIAGKVRKKLPRGVNEGLMVDERGLLLEGLSSNFFAVQNSVLWTAGEGVLEGITRGIVLEAARELGIQVRLESIHEEKIPLLSECFITSASRGVLPVVRVDDCVIGVGTPGQVTHLLMERYEQHIKGLATDI